MSEVILSNEDFSDEELKLTEADLARALATRIGGRETKKETSQEETKVGKVSHE